MPLVALGVLVVMLMASPSTILPPAPGGQRPVRWLSDPFAPVNKFVAPAPLAPDIARAFALSTWPALPPLTNAHGAPEWIIDGCLDIGERNAARCTYGRATASRTVAVLGDSVATGWLQALRKAAFQEDWRIHVLTRRQCPNAAIDPALRTIVTASCANHQRWAVGQVRRLRPDLVVMSNSYGGATAQQWAVGISTTLREVTPSSGRVVILSPPPGTASINTCRSRGDAPSQCTHRVTPVHHQLGVVERDQVARYGGRFVDTRPWFCRDNACPALVRGTPVTFDGRHLTAAYSRLLSPHVRGAVRRLQ